MCRAIAPVAKWLTEEQVNERVKQQEAVRQESISEHLYCQSCGGTMRERLMFEISYDRKTGERQTHGPVYWECPNYDSWCADTEKPPRTWAEIAEGNPHDRVYLRYQHAATTR